MLRRKSNTKQFGDEGEKYAQKLLIKNGYKIITSKYRTRFGEIDIIAHDGDTLVFVEVKTRRSMRQGLPEEAVDERKLAKIQKAAQYYVMNHPDAFKKRRIDVVSILIGENGTIKSKIIKVV